MKTEISSLGLHYIVQEFQSLIGAKVDKIYMPKKDELLFQLHLPNVGKKIIRILPGSFVYLTNYKTPSPQKPFGYCLYLRKKLHNARLKEVFQKESERIIEFVFERRQFINDEPVDNTFRFIVELFTKGNAILCNESYMILSPLQIQVWKDRELKPRKQYIYPKKKYNLFEVDEGELKKLLSQSDKGSVVKALAIQLGLGGVYAEEICLNAKVDKNIKPNELNDEKDIKKLFSVLDKLRKEKIDAQVIYDKKSNDKKTVKDIVPFKLKTYSDYESKKFSSFNEALDEILTSEQVKKIQDVQVKEKEKKISKIDKIIKAQEKQVAKCEEEEAAFQKQGELIYENYPLVEEILTEINKARERYSWKEIKAKLKGHKIVKDIKEKQGKIIIEI